MIHPAIIRKNQAFSLVELSIVLVILGLLVGGVLSGKSLIEAATIKSQISQITEYSVAARTFRDKYFYLPGDLPEPTATNAGFNARGVLGGQGDGDGAIRGWQFGMPNPASYYLDGENILFWTDLTKAGLIAGNFTAATATGNLPASSSSSVISQYFPAAKMTGNYVFLTGDTSLGWDGGYMQQGKSYFALQRINSMTVNSINAMGGSNGLTVLQAYNIDMKFDDGNPTKGKVAALLQNGWTVSANAGLAGMASAASTTSCTDTNNSAAAPVTYSLSIDGGSYKTCGLMFDAIN